jgi:methionyl-tRNA formyltransferase
VYLTDVAIVAAPTTRTQIYLQALRQYGVLPNYALIMQNSSSKMLPGQQKENPLVIECSLEGIRINTSETIGDTLNQSGVNFESVDSTNINSSEIIEKIKKRDESVFIFSGFGGAILREEILSLGKKILHVHGGYLPDYKGSTTNYYNLIDTEECGASSIFLEKDIDCGPVLTRQKFSPPENREEMDYLYDSAIRSRVLVETLQAFTKNREWKFDYANNKGGETYFIIHPVLKHIAILASGNG